MENLHSTISEIGISMKQRPSISLSLSLFSFFHALNMPYRTRVHNELYTFEPHIESLNKRSIVSLRSIDKRRRFTPRASWNDRFRQSFTDQVFHRPENTDLTDANFSPEPAQLRSRVSLHRWGASRREKKGDDGAWRDAYAYLERFARHIHFRGWNKKKTSRGIVRVQNRSHAWRGKRVIRAVHDA